MTFQNFNDWFAVIDANDPQEIYSGRLIYERETGIKLLVVDRSFDLSSDKFIRSGVIHGLLDYQRPTTLLNSFVSVISPGSMSADSRYMRSSFIVTVNSIIKNIHVSNVEEKAFLDLRTTSPAFGAWIAWRLFKDDISKIFDEEFSNINVSESIKIHQKLANEASFDVDAFPAKGASDNETNFSFIPKVSLKISFAQAVTYNDVMELSQRIDIMFSFLIGTRLPIEPEYMLTNHEVEWNKKSQKIIAESVFVPAYNRNEKAPYISERMFTYENTPLDLCKILEICLGKNKDIFNRMNLVLLYRMRDMKTADYFFEIIGSLENTDKRLNGESKNGKNVHLRDRLKRLIGVWTDNGFKGSPDITLIVKLRNMRAHGHSSEYTLDDTKTMSTLNSFLTAVSTYYILSELGFDRNMIAERFRRSLYQLGYFVPDEFRH